jgi:hypothetical protein
LLARLATLWFILQSFVMEKGLFPRRPDEALIAIYALDAAIRMFCGCIQQMDFFRLRHDSFSQDRFKP